MTGLRYTLENIMGSLCVQLALVAVVIVQLQFGDVLSLPHSKEVTQADVRMFSEDALVQSLEEYFKVNVRLLYYEFNTNQIKKLRIFVGITKSSAGEDNV